MVTLDIVISGDETARLVISFTLRLSFESGAEVEGRTPAIDEPSVKDGVSQILKFLKIFLFYTF